MRSGKGFSGVYLKFVKGTWSAGKDEAKCNGRELVAHTSSKRCTAGQNVAGTKSRSTITSAELATTMSCQSVFNLATTTTRNGRWTAEVSRLIPGNLATCCVY